MEERGRGGGGGGRGAGVHLTSLVSVGGGVRAGVFELTGWGGGGVRQRVNTDGYEMPSSQGYYCLSELDKVIRIAHTADMNAHKVTERDTSFIVSGIRVSLLYNG